MEFKYTEKQQTFIDSIVNGDNIFLTGKAGAGKTFIAKKAIEVLEKMNKKIVVLAPTGIAANNAGGQTLHSFFGFNPFGVLDFDSCSYLKSEKKRMINLIDVMLIDEVSMMRADIFDGINWTLLKNHCKSIHNIQLILIGDLKQLKPVADDNMAAKITSEYDGVEFYNAKIHDKLNLVNIQLDEVMRQSDPEFIEALNVIRDGGKSEYFRKFVKSIHSGTVLAPHNATVNRYNVDGLRAIQGETYTFKAKVDGNVKAEDFNMESIIYVKDGAKVMYLVNSKNNNLFNGAIGIFRVKENRFFIEVNGILWPLDPVVAAKKEYVLNKEADKLELKEIGSIEQYPIKLAYALSIHKSQGLTFDEVTIDLTLPCFAEGQMYVALSRVRTPEGLTILTK